MLYQYEYHSMCGHGHAITNTINEHPYFKHYHYKNSHSVKTKAMHVHNSITKESNALFHQG